VIDVIIALLIWTLVVCVAVTRASDSDRSLLYASTAIAVSLTTNIAPIYVAGDAVLGGRNWLDLISNLALMFGISFLFRAVLRAATTGPDRLFERGATVVLLAVCVAVTIAFVFIDAPATSTTFMQTYGEQVAAAAYSVIQFTFVGCAVSAMGWLSVRQWSRSDDRLARSSVLLIAAGCGCALMLSFVIITMDILHANGATQLMARISIAYEPLYLEAMALLCVGFSIPPVSRKVRSWRYEQATKAFIRVLRPLWEEAVGGAVTIPVAQYTATGRCEVSHGNELLLHRMVVEIWDAMFNERLVMSPKSENAVRLAERHLLLEGRDAANGGETKG
jgi:hypothetical protein